MGTSPEMIYKHYAVYLQKASMPGDQNALNGPAAESFAIRMAALTLLQACTFATGTKFTAIVFAVLGNAFADFDFAIAIGMSTTLFSHDSIPPMWGRAVLMPLRGEKIRAVRSHCRSSQCLRFLRQKFLTICGHMKASLCGFSTKNHTDSEISFRVFPTRRVIPTALTAYYA